MLSVNAVERVTIGSAGGVDLAIGAIQRLQKKDELVAAGITLLIALARERAFATAIYQAGGHSVAAEAVKNFPGNVGLVKKSRELARVIKAARGNPKGEQSLETGVKKVKNVMAVRSLRKAGAGGISTHTPGEEAQKSAISMYKPSLKDRRLNIVG